MIGTAPLTARLDILVRDPTLGLVGFEVKTGFDPTYTIAQAVLYPHLPSGGLAFLSSYKIVPFGLQPMQTLPPIKMFTFDHNVLTGRNTLKPIVPEPLPKKGLVPFELHFPTSFESLGFEQ